jgi:23S rRNA (cytosine1962-C5)-methyltransferase
MEFKILTTTPEKDYELLDSGQGEKLERYGSIVIARPDPQALWKKGLDETSWQKAQAHFVKETSAHHSEVKAAWKLEKGVPKRWNIEFAGLQFVIKPAVFKHTGLFPEQRENWLWLKEIIGAAKQNREKISVLNLFGYTGGATLAAASAGADVVHVDGSRSAITWARENADASQLTEKPIRWILDDARAFVEREVRRGNTYDGIIMDPPAFGRGPKGEVWKIEEHLLGLLNACQKLISRSPLFFLINGYASGYSALAYEHILSEVMKEHGGRIEIGELTIEEQSQKRLLPAGIFSRWKM